MKLLYFLNTYIFLNLLFINSEAQNSLFPTKKEVSIGTYLSTSGQNPFWLRSNQYGTVPLESQTLNLSASFHKEFDSTKISLNKLQKLGFGYGINPVVIVGKVNKVLLPEAYIKTRLGAFEFYAGRRREIVGLVDTTLTSGSYIWSGNALPIPKLQISIPNYTSIIGKGLLSIKGAFAHGWFGTQGVIKNYYLHQKYLYGRVGKPSWKVKFYGGINHQVQWGGEIKNLSYKNVLNTFREDGTLPNSFNDFVRITTGVSVGQLRIDGKIDTTQFSSFDLYNRSGNHLGSVDIAIELDFKKINLLIYRQSIYEDGSLYHMNNITDGILGIGLKLKKNSAFKKVVFEVVNTKNQGGTFDPRPWIQGNDNYFNHGQYLNGWSYNNSVIGTPLISFDETTSKNLPRIEIINNSLSYTTTRINNNRVFAFNLSAFLSYKRFSIASKYIYSINRGTFTEAFPPHTNQNSILIQINHSLLKKNLSQSLCISIDNGNLFNNTLGFFYTIKKSFTE